VSSHRFLPDTVERRLGTMRELYARGGSRTVLWHTLYVLGYRRTFLFELSLTPPPARVPLPAGIVCDFLDTDQLDAFAAHHPDLDRDAAAGLLASGERCFATWADDRIVASRWVAAGRVRLGDVGLDVSLPAGTAYVSHSFTSPDMRGRRVAAASGTDLANRLAAEGLTRLVGTVLPENLPGLQSAAHAGYRLAGRLATVRIGPLPAVRVPFLPPRARPPAERDSIERA
jgi:hypothetical protein